MKIKKRTIILSTVLIFIVVFLVMAASKNRQLIGLLMLPSQEYSPTVIPSDTTQLFEYDGYIKNEIVYIYVQGGPNWELFDRALSPLSQMPHSGTFVKVFPYQSQIINHTILGSKTILKDEQAEHEVRTSAEMLYRTITYFKKRNKKVFVFCISHGSQIGLELLRHYPATFDKLALTMIRLDINLEAIELSENGKVPYFKPGQEITRRDFVPQFLQFSRLNIRAGNMIAMMKVSRNRYTELLQDRDLSNVIYVYGKFDNKVGIPDQNELDFLTIKGVGILELDCGHDDLGSIQNIQKINDLLLD